MTEEAKIWIGKKVTYDIIGNCCEISNLCSHTYPLVVKDHNKVNVEKDLNKIKFLLINFMEYINPDTMIDDFYSKIENRNQWWGQRHHFKLYVKDVVQTIRDEKLKELVG